MSSGIYLLTNLINNHLYIGKSINIEKRFTNHINTSNNPNSPEYNYPIHRAIRKYGSKNFSLSILESIDTYIEDIANQQEKYWIQKLNTFYSNEHYNATLGGDGKLGRKLNLEERKKTFSKTKRSLSNYSRKVESKKA